MKHYCILLLTVLLVACAPKEKSNDTPTVTEPSGAESAADNGQQSKVSSYDIADKVPVVAPTITKSGKEYAVSIDDMTGAHIKYSLVPNYKDTLFYSYYDTIFNKKNFFVGSDAVFKVYDSDNEAKPLKTIIVGRDIFEDMLERFESIPGSCAISYLNFKDKSGDTLRFNIQLVHPESRINIKFLLNYINGTITPDWDYDWKYTPVTLSH